MEVASRIIQALGIVCGASTYRSWNAVRDIEENRHGLDNQKTKLANEALKAHKFRTTVQNQSRKDSQTAAGAKKQ